MKILHAIHDFLPRHRAGSELYAFQLCRALGGRCEVAVLCGEYAPGRPHGSVERRVLADLPVVELVNNWCFDSFEQTYRSPGLGASLESVLDGFAPDVLHVHGMQTLSLDLPPMARRRGIPVVATLHDYSLFCPSGGQLVHCADRSLCAAPEPARCAACFASSPYQAQMALARIARNGTAGLRLAGSLARGLRSWMPRGFDWAGRALRRLPLPAPGPEDIRRRMEQVTRTVEAVDLFVSPSEYLAGRARGLGVPAQKLRVSDYGLEPFAPLPHAPGNGRLRVGFVGTLAWHKGVHELLLAARELPPDRIEVQVHGDLGTFPSYSTHLRELAAGLPVRFMGGFEPAQRPAVYSGMDVLAVPSLWPENSPLVIHEAFLASIPVVAPDLGGIPGLVRQGRDGILYPAGRPGALAGALRALLDRPDLVPGLGRSSPPVKTVEEDAREWEARYREAMAGSRPRPARAALRQEDPAGHRGACRHRTPISLLLLTRDGMATLPSLLDRVRRQRFQGGALETLEIVAVDSGSTDGTVELLRKEADRLIEIPPDRFEHGSTRNLGLEACRGDLVVLLVQDALPLTRTWLHHLTAPLLADAEVAGSFARQVPRPSSGPLSRMYVERHLAHGREPRVARLAPPSRLERLDAPERVRLCTFDNVCSCVRRETWQRHPFPGAPFAEDMAWAREVLLAGHSLVYAPDAVVLHSHDRSAGYELRRTYLAHRQLRSLFGLRTIPTPLHLAPAVAGTLASHLLCLALAPGGPRLSLEEVGHAVALAVALPLGQYLGSRAATGAWPAPRVEGV